MRKAVKGGGYGAMKTELTVKSEREMRKVSSLGESRGRRALVSNLDLKKQ